MIQVDSRQEIKIKVEVCPLIFPESPRAWIYLTWAWRYDFCKRHWWSWFARQIARQFWSHKFKITFDDFACLISAQDQHKYCCIPWDLQVDNKFVKVLSLGMVENITSRHELKFCFATLSEKANWPRNLHNKSRIVLNTKTQVANWELMIQNIRL